MQFIDTQVGWAGRVLAGQLLIEQGKIVGLVGYCQKNTSCSYAYYPYQATPPDDGSDFLVKLIAHSVSNTFFRSSSPDGIFRAGLYAL
jgi:hypothetical protein